MFDIQLRRQIDPYLMWLARRIQRWGISANALTWWGFFAGMTGAICVSQGYFGWAFALIAVNRLFDGLDGCVARVHGPSDLGGFLDIALDLIFYSGVPFAFALYSADNHLPACFLIYSFFGTGSSFLAFAVISAKRGVTSDKANKKSFFYSTGLIEGAETTVFLLLLCIIPDAFSWLAWTFGGLCWITTAIRIAVGCQVFRDS